MVKTYTELSKFSTFDERFTYLLDPSMVGDQTFGGSRFLNQHFYRSKEWRRIRDAVIVRDAGLDLGIEGHPISGRVIVHHLNPLRKEDFIHQTKFLLDPEYMICMSHNTHNAIHYGSVDFIQKDYIPRRPNDTCPWR